MENGGFKFRPTHKECIVYLCLKVTASPFPNGVTIPDRNPYDVQEHAGIFSDAEKYGDLYFFTKLTSKGKTGTNNVNRTVGEGTWHGNTIKKVYHNGRKLGMYTKLSYQEKGTSINHMRFSMTEYTLLKNTKIKYNPLTDYVLCHLEKNERWINGKRVSKSIRESLSNEIIAGHIPEAEEAHHVAAVDSVELPSDQIFREPIYDQQAFDETYVAPLPYNPTPAAGIQDQTSFNQSAYSQIQENLPVDNYELLDFEATEQTQPVPNPMPACIYPCCCYDCVAKFLSD